jgi:hypothetical protein
MTDKLQMQKQTVTEISGKFSKNKEGNIFSHAYDYLALKFVKAVEKLYQENAMSGLECLSAITMNPDQYNTGFVDIAQRVTADLTGPR